MSDTTNPPDLVAQLLKDSTFISDLARYHESLLTEQFVRRKYGNLSEAAWARLGESDELVHAIELETIRRTRSGASKREKSQQHILAAPDVLNSIMTDERASPRHRVDAIKTLDTMSATGPDAVPQPDQFTISIILSADERLTFSKYPTKHDGKTIARKTINHDHVDVIDNDADSTNDDDEPRWLPIVPDKQDRGGGGVPSW